MHGVKLRGAGLQPVHKGLAAWRRGAARSELARGQCGGQVRRAVQGAVRRAVQGAVQGGMRRAMRRAVQGAGVGAEARRVRRGQHGDPQVDDVSRPRAPAMQ